jgi:predicted transcriptional regulator
LVFSGEDFTTRLMNDMDPQLLDLVKTKVNSFIKWDLVRFLRENPNTADTAENIAKYIGRNAATVEPELKELVDSQVMESKPLEGVPVYSLTTDTAMRELIDRFITACEDRHFRVKVIYHIVRGMR